MRQRSKRTVAIALVATMLLAAAGGALANTNEPAVDTSTSVASLHSAVTTHSELTPNGNITDFDGQAGNNTTVQYLAYTNSSKLVFMQGDNGTTVYENDSPTTVNWNATPTPEHGHFNVTVEHDALADVERGINENVTMTMKIINDTGNTTEVATYETFYIETDNSTTVQNIGDTDVDDEDIVEVKDEENDLFTITSLGISELEFTVLDLDERDVDGDNTDVVLVFSNDSVADDFDEAVTSGIEDEDPIYRMPIHLESDDDDATQWIRVYSEEVPDDLDEDDDTYGVYKDGGIGGEDGIEINLGDEFEDSDEITVTGTGHVGSFGAFEHRIRTSTWNPLSMIGGLGVDLDLGDDELMSGMQAVFLGAAGARRGLAG